LRNYSNVLWGGLLSITVPINVMMTVIENTFTYEKFVRYRDLVIDTVTTAINDFGHNLLGAINQFMTNITVMLEELEDTINQAAVIIAAFCDYVVNMTTQVANIIQTTLLEIRDQIVNEARAAAQTLENVTYQVLEHINSTIAHIENQFRDITDRVTTEFDRRFNAIINSIGNACRRVMRERLGVENLTLQSVAANSRNIYFGAGNSRNIIVTFNRLNDLSFNLRRMNSESDEEISRTLNIVRNLLSNVNAEYREANVRTASSAVLREIETIERLYRDISRELWKKELSLKRAADTYRLTETRIISSVIKA